MNNIIYGNTTTEIKTPILYSNDTIVRNDYPDSEWMGEVAAYPFLQTGSVWTGVSQARRRLYYQCSPLLEYHLDERKYDVYCTKYVGNISNAELFGQSHHSDGLAKACEYILANYPEYEAAVNKMMNGNELYPHSIFYIKTFFWNRYKDWVDEILRAIDISHDNKYGSWIAERLFTVFVYHNIPPERVKIVSCYAWDKVTGLLKNTTDGVCA